MLRMLPFRFRKRSQLLCRGADGPEKSLVNRALPHLRISGVSPHGCQLAMWNILSLKNESIEYILMHWIGELHHDQFHSSRKLVASGTVANFNSVSAIAARGKYRLYSRYKSAWTFGF